MGHSKIAEIKIHVQDLSPYRTWLNNKQAKFIGKDHQVDTYFTIPNHRLKLREGNIETTLIHYNRPNTHGHKLSDVTYHKVSDHSESLKSVLKKLYPIDVIIEKDREIYWIDNTKFHLDEVNTLGSFIEIEVMDMGGKYSQDEIHRKLDNYLNEWQLNANQGIPESYADLKRNYEK